MKNRFLFFFITLFLASSVATAQVNRYHPLGDSGNIWYNGETYNPDDGSGDLDFWYNIYQVGGDTVINNVAYKKLMFDQFNITNPFAVNGGYTPVVYSGYAVRDDTVNRKVFIYGDDANSGTDTEQLLYDFNLNIGDTLPNGIVSDTESGVYVVSIDSFRLDDGTYRKSWGLQSHLDTPVAYDLVEGVGCTGGFFVEITGAYSVEGDGAYLSCFTSNNKTLFIEDTFELHSCGTPTGIYNPNTVTAQLFPNPVTQGGSITIKGITEEYTFTLDNLLGQTVFSKEITSPAQPINLPNSILGGVYLCNIKTQSNLVFVKKIVVL